MKSSSARVLGVGLVGLTPARSWAAVAHLPALACLQEHFKVVGIANSSVESAQRAVASTKIGSAFELDHMLQSKDIDIVSVTVKVAGHFTILERAIAAGKNVYCEWPLALTVNDARQLAAQADAAGVKAVIGLQGIVSPELSVLQNLVASGAVGKVLSTSISAAAGVWGSSVGADQVYSLDVDSGANLLTVPFGHLVPMIEKVLGPIATISAELATGRDKVVIRDTGEMADATAPDQLVIAGTMVGGAVLSIHMRGGLPSAEPFVWEIYGSDGVVRMVGDRGQPQMAACRIYLGKGEGPLEEVVVDDVQPSPLPHKGPARNVGLIYASMGADIHSGSNTAPTFAQAVRVHEVIEAVKRSAAFHQRTTV